jgi:hypothetical protein
MMKRLPRSFTLIFKHASAKGDIIDPYSGNPWITFYSKYGIETV